MQLLQPTTQLLEQFAILRSPRLVPAIVWEIDSGIAIGFSLTSRRAHDPLCLSADENNKVRLQKVYFTAQKVPVFSQL